MARGHGRILTSIWEDSDFLALDEREQRLYLFLISQPNLNHAGLLPLTLRRWARKAHGLTSAELEKRLQGLEAARFIVMDEDTEELLIRSFVRNDGVWRMPKVMGAMVSGALEISSPRLRRALLEEMDRIPVEELSDEPTKVRGGIGPSIRAQVVEHIAALRRGFGGPRTGPGGGSGTPSAPPSVTPSGTPSDTPVEGGREGSTRGRAGAQTRAAPAPTPAPTPAPEEEGGGGGPLAKAGGQPRAPRRPDGRIPIDDADFRLNDSMRRWALQTFGPNLDIDYETAQFVSHHRSEGSRRKSWPDEWQKWIRRSHKWAAEDQKRRPDNVIRLPSGQTLTGTDAKVASWMAVAEQLRQEGDPA
ncbi:hypothetical protein [Streptomyces sp. NPDC001404]|uniref:hypothetical protein n=1 Tax=Streptomyces sp. NPDC001404 TaxID=3364571 RepID=UPI0036B99F7F